jgi:hypothetical protein
LISWQNDSRLRTKEYADRIRRSTSIVTAKVERWGELSERFYQDIQPTIVDVSEKSQRHTIFSKQIACCIEVVWTLNQSRRSA